MSGYYKPKHKTGDEYVKSTQEFAAYTIHCLLKMPKKWKDYLLDPVAHTALKIESIVCEANKIYINEKNQTRKEYLAALEARMGMLKEAMRKFSAYDSYFDRVMLNIDFLESESRRLKSILSTLIETAEYEKGYEMSINVHQRLNEYEYTALNGTQRFKIGITNKQKEHWVDLESIALAEIRKRYGLDHKTYLSAAKNN